MILLPKADNELITIQIIKCKHYDRCFITLDLNEKYSDQEIFNEYSLLHNLLKQESITPLYEKIFGNQVLENDLHNLRKVYINGVFPSCFINFETVTGSPISSIFIYGIKNLNEQECKIVKTSNNHTELITPTHSHLFILGTDAQKNEKSSVLNVYENIFEQLESQLQLLDYNVKNIIRTWFYMNNINKKYSDFNIARRVFFDRGNISYSDNSNMLPSSTCIGAPIQKGEDINMNAYCIKYKSKDVSIKRVYNNMQNEANGTTYQFKPTFARGTAITTEDYVEVQISGTASINIHGESMHNNEAYLQIVLTLNNVFSILQQYDMNFNNFVQSTCYFNSKEYYLDFVRALDNLKIENFSFTYVIGEVCREELLFEIDGIALKELKEI